MEDGSGTWPDGSDDHHDDLVADSNRTPENERHDQVSPIDKMKFPWTSPSPSDPTSPTSPPRATGHRRTLSGSILARFNFLRPAGEDGMPSTRDDTPHSPKSTKNRRSMGEYVGIPSPGNTESGSLQHSKTRKRKGSLRKTALLGGRRFAVEGRERSKSLLQRSPSSKQPLQPTFPQLPVGITEASPTFSGGHYPPPYQAEQLEPQLRRQFSYESAAVTAARLSLVTSHQASENAALSSHPSSKGESGETTLRSPLDLKSPASQTSYASTTDEEENVSFHRPSAVTKLLDPATAPLPPAAGNATSYFPSETSLARTRSSHSSRSSKPRPSPLRARPLTPVSPPPPAYDYTETEYWGWIILFVTWLVFTVGMGSCLEVWSWAWDVGETPYAPPELEDDPTLPIVGYYPALIVLTGVVAWVWITVAWVGMKYFRHAKIEV